MGAVLCGAEAVWWGVGEEEEEEKRSLTRPQKDANEKVWATGGGDLGRLAGDDCSPEGRACARRADC